KQCSMYSVGGAHAPLKTVHVRLTMQSCNHAIMIARHHAIERCYELRCGHLRPGLRANEASGCPCTLRRLSWSSCGPARACNRTRLLALPGRHLHSLLRTSRCVEQ